MNPKFFIVTTIPGSLCFFDGQYERFCEEFDVTAISSEREQLELFGRQRGIKVHYIPMEREISLLTDICGLFKFIGYFRKEHPEIVHGNTPKGGLLSMLAAWFTRVPVRIYMCHGLRYQGCSGFKRKLLMFMERISCRCATQVVCVSKGVARVLIDDRITNKQPVVVWNGSVNGIDACKFNPNNYYDKVAIREKYGISKDNFVLTFVGRIVKDKGVNELVEAFSVLSQKNSEMKLLLIGRFEEANAILERTKEIIENNSAIIAPGPQYNIPEILSITDLFVLPSYREGFGLSLMEAGAMGVPSVATDIIGCNEVVVDHENGILIPPYSSSSIVDAVENLYNDKELLFALRNKSRESIVNRFESQTLLNKYMEYYKSLIVSTK